MQIALKQLNPSPRPVRTSWNEEAMNELAQSIKEQGVVVPIKVRFVGDLATWVGPHKWEIIYGHRRVEASRRAGRVYIEAIIEEGVDDTEALTQAIIENVQREGLSHFDQGRAYLDLKKLGLTYAQIALCVGKSEGWIGRCVRLVKDKNLQKLQDPVVFDAADKGDLIRGATRDDPTTRRAFAAKVVDEGLTAAQTRKVANALKETQSPKARERILREPIVPEAPVLSEAIKMLVDADEDEERSWWAHQAGEGAKNILRKIKVTREFFKRGWLVVERGAIGPEHMPYLEKRLRKLGEYIFELADDLDERRKFAIGE